MPPNGYYRRREAQLAVGSSQGCRDGGAHFKISGPTRARRGAEFIARGFSALETCRRQGRDVMGSLHGAVIGWIDKTIPPNLLPALVPSG